MKVKTVIAILCLGLSACSLGKVKPELPEEEMVTTARTHVMRFPDYRDDIERFHILDSSQPHNGVTVSQEENVVTFFHEGRVYDGPFVKIVVRMEKDGSLIKIEKQVVEAGGP